MFADAHLGRKAITVSEDGHGRQVGIGQRLSEYSSTFFDICPISRFRVSLLT